MATTLKTILVDDEPASLNYLTELCSQIPNLNIAAKFSNPHTAMDYLLQDTIDLAILDIEMPELNGIEIAHKIQQQNIHTCVIFATGYEQYALEAFHYDAIAYLLKPCNCEDIIKAVDKAIRLSTSKKPHVFIKTFGHFDVFVKEEPLYFANAKAKELLAVLVDHQGGIVTMDTMIDFLWENRPYDDNVKQLYRKAINYLNKLFEEHGLTFFISNRGSCYIKKSEVNCDLFDLFDGKPHASDSYYGEYLFDYSWSENTLTSIENYIQRNK